MLLKHYTFTAKCLPDDVCVIIGRKRNLTDLDSFMSILGPGELELSEHKPCFHHIKPPLSERDSLTLSPQKQTFSWGLYSVIRSPYPAHYPSDVSSGGLRLSAAGFPFGLQSHSLGHKAKTLPIFKKGRRLRSVSARLPWNGLCSHAVSDHPLPLCWVLRVRGH